ncbi:dual specificity protein phosphatase [Oceanobacillus sp. HCA-5259]|uniref:protein-tyrosine phosphatase family protein n=1 Tax=Oceanobacillus sp. HCA-5259 TaxID=3134661 RepID=UPI0030BE2F5C
MSDYNELVKDRIFIGGADDVQDAMKEKDIDVVIDLRSETNKSNNDSKHHTVHQPILDDAENQDESVKKAINSVTKAYNEGKNVFFHCSAGRNRTGTVAIGTLLELNLAKDLEEAEEKTKSIRSKIEIKPEMKESIKNLYDK